MDYINVFLIVAFIACSIVPIICIRMKINSLKEYTKIKIGMSKDKVLSIMGSGYTVSRLKNSIKYEWKINGGKYNNIKLKTMRVAVYFKNGKVVDIKTLNI